MTSKSAEAIVAFDAGRAHFYNIRFTDSNAQFKKALALDPTFLQARVYAGFTTPGAEGEALMEKAWSDPATASLPEAERVHMQYLLANRKGDTTQVLALTKKQVELAPDDWQSHFIFGEHTFFARDFETAALAFERAIAIEPKAGPVYNMLGYTRLEQKRMDDAIAALQKYVELAPGEANPLDSLGEAQLAAGKFADAEASFMKAIAVDPKFTGALEAAATARALQGNWQGAREAMTAAIAQSVRPVDKSNAERRLAWLGVAEGKLDDGLAAFEKVEAEGAVEVPVFAGLDRAYILMNEGRLEEASKATAAAWQRAQKPELDSDDKAMAQRIVLGQQAVVAALAGKGDDAQKSLGELETLVKQMPDNVAAQRMLGFVRGRVLLATDAKAAQAELAKCPDDDAHCNYFESLAATKAGDTALATAAEESVRNNPQRTMDYVWVVERLKKN